MGRKLLCREEWNRARTCENVAEETKFISGMLITLNSFLTQIGPTNTQGFRSYTTTEYKLHALETATGYRFAITTDPSVSGAAMATCLPEFYALFVEDVLKNPMYKIGEDVSKCVTFVEKLRKLIESQPFFGTLAS